LRLPTWPREFRPGNLWRARHRRIRLTLALVGFFYLALALSREAEIFPFFSWRLFDLRAPDNVRYSLVLEEVRGKALSPPRNMLEVRGPARALSSIDSRSLVRKLGIALQRKDPSAAAHRQLLESAFLEPLKPIRYQVVAEKFDAASFLASRKITQSETLGAFALK
jgi:hypothetical protein